MNREDRISVSDYERRLMDGTYDEAEYQRIELIYGKFGFSATYGDSCGLGFPKA